MKKKQSTGRNSVLAAALAAGVSLAAIQASPALAQSQNAAQRHGEVVIKRDAYGVPSIHADDVYSLYYGLGYALAEDRLFQIESMRRAASGRAAEAFGPEFLEHDKTTLMNYSPRGLEPQLAALEGEHREALDGMTAGINARIRDVLAARDTLLPRQFAEYGFDPQADWEAIDIVMCWIGHLLFQFSDYTAQISNTGLISALTEMHGEDKAREIFSSMRWSSDPTAPTTVKKIDQEEGRATFNLPGALPGEGAARWASLSPISPEAAESHARLSMVLWGADGPDNAPSASNTWLVNGDRLADADSVMVSGPQVGDWTPSKIWAASIYGAGFTVTGSTYPGLPYFHFGTNGDIAWGRTALAGSILDVYQEELHPDDPHRYRHKGEWFEMESESWTIEVKGESPVSFQTYSTVHGPVIAFDEENGTAYSKRRAWAGHELDTMFAYYEEMKARDFEEWSEAISQKSNNQSQYYSDKDGNIAYLQAGRYPIRPDNHTIHLPSAGDGSMEWEGFQPFSENAKVLNPKQDYIANWNNRPSPDIQNTDTLLWSRMNRVDAINVELEAKESLTTKEIWDINQKTSYASELHRYFAPLIEEAVEGLRDSNRVRQVADAITGWNGQEDDPTYSGYYAAPGRTAYYAWLQAAMTALFEKDLPEEYLGGCNSRPSYNCPYGQPIGASLLYFALTDGETGSPVMDYDFLHGRDGRDLIRGALRTADKTLSEEHGREIAGWLSQTSAKTWPSSSPSRVPWAGEDEEFSFSPDQKRGAMNALYVFRNGEVSMCDAVPPGQSGFIAPDGTKDPHYGDQLSLYASFDCKARAVTEEQADTGARSEKRLEF